MYALYGWVLQGIVDGTFSYIVGHVHAAILRQSMKFKPYRQVELEIQILCVHNYNVIANLKHILRSGHVKLSVPANLKRKELLESPTSFKRLVREKSTVTYSTTGQPGL